jgi:hypothetical protein
MANLHAIATATATLRARLAEILPLAVAGATASVVRVGDTAGANGLPAVGANVFLTGTRPNAALRNADLPQRERDGTLRQRPVTAIDLDYLVSFYAPDMTTVYRLLGAVLVSLHARPLFTPAMILAAETGLPPSGLDRQVDRLRMTPIDMPLEEMSRLWSVMLQTRYVPSLALRLGPVLMEAELAVAPGLPVREFDLAVLPLQPPELTALQAAANPAAPVEAGIRAALLGRFDIARPLVALVDGRELSPLPPLRPDRLEVDLPADLPPGPHQALVRADIPMGTPPTARPGIASNILPFMVQPAIALSGGVPDVAPALAVDPPHGPVLAVRLTQALPAGTEALLHLTDPATEQARLFRAEPLAAPGAQLIFPIPGAPAGDHIVRIAIRGALSHALREEAEGHPQRGRLVAPMVTLP